MPWNRLPWIVRVLVLAIKTAPPEPACVFVRKREPIRLTPPLASMAPPPMPLAAEPFTRERLTSARLAVSGCRSKKRNAEALLRTMVALLPRIVSEFVMTGRPLFELSGATSV